MDDLGGDALYLKSSYDKILDRARLLSSGKIYTESWEVAMDLITHFMTAVGLKTKKVWVSLEHSPIFLNNKEVVQKYFVVQWE